MQRFYPMVLLAAAGSAIPLSQRQDDAWQVTRFSAYVAAHSITQIITFSVALPESTDPVQCSAATGAAISSSPFLLPITNGKCVDGSGLSFNFTQVENFAIKLDVQNAEGTKATHTSDTGLVTVTQTGPTPLDTLTSYVGPQDFALAVVEDGN